MNAAVQNVIHQAMRLTPQERELVIGVLTHSQSEEESDPELEALIAKRIAEIESGAVRGIPLKEAKAPLFGA